ncbi:hypothetical protein SPBR_01651 [Sporothrix brasiliensis 5110]|uniref:C6 zinc finger domain containing protein n=1 Tax=Sporothrix brasiliensis 5110 TaxID=1398154 RepID=A0A0C2IQ84_9PEZI|nr:uncharacterized protein SPBR_01651 [Sporothrix brasiliensis 5110]KIH91206.1 hypothetical protein SPBR_01651 [Sporothrix brasiliensis 5110]
MAPTPRQHVSPVHPLQRTPGPLLCARPRHLVAGGAPVASQQEHAAFQFFTHTGVSSLASCTDIDFWTRLVPQLAHADAAIYHASVAVGALLMGAHDAVAGRAFRAQLTAFAIERQNRAIQSTVRGLDAHRRRPAEADVMTLVLLFCIEALQGREHQALTLCQRGILALATAHTMHAMPAGLAALLDRIRLQCRMFNAGSAVDESPRLKQAMARLLAGPPRAPFASLDAARDEQAVLIAGVQHMVAARWGGLSDGSTDAGKSGKNGVQSPALDAALLGWRARFDRYWASPHACARTPEPGTERVASLLRLRYLIARVWMADGPDRSEMAYDDHVEVFAGIAAEAERCLGVCGQADPVEQIPPMHAKPTPFTFEMGLIPPLYWALLRCRQPLLRRRLLALLRQAPAQEGLWSRDIMVQVARAVMAYEEASLGLGPGVWDEARDARDALLQRLPAEEARIKVVRIGLRTTLANGRQGDAVECFGMPYGREGGLQDVLAFSVFCDPDQ